MKKTLYRIVAICLIISICLPMFPVEAEAVSYNGSSSYKSGKYYKALTQVTLTGDQRKDIVNVAKSQIGYQEGSSSSQLSGTKYGGKNYTEYGRWYGMQDMWCAMFVSWCANVAGISTSIVPKHAYTPSGLSWFKSRGLAYSRAKVAAGGYTPQAGDIIYFKSSRNSNTTNHIGIVTGYSKGTVYTIEGNTSSATISTNGGAVAAKSYSINNTYIVYICKPNYKQISSSSSNNSGSSTDSNNWVPNSIQQIAFNATYYANKYPDLKKAFGTDESKLYNHFLAFGAKEGRQASAVFDVKTYVTKNADLKAAFGSDYKAAIKHFASFGINENRVTAPAVNIGTGFKARINVSTATLNLSLSDTDVIAYTPSEAAAQIWKFDRQSDGTYKITNTKNGKVLGLNSASKKAGAKVQISDSNDTTTQRWYIYESGVSGKYIFRPACSTGVVMGVKGDSKSALAAIQSVNYTNSNGQKFGITKISEANTEKPVDIGTDFYAKIGSSNATNMNLSLMDSNVILYNNSDALAQVWRFERQDDGSYIIINQKNSLVLTVDGNKSASGTNVVISKNTKATGQKWFIYAKGDYYQLRPANIKDCALDVYGGLTSNCTNVQIYTKNDTGAQLFKITKGDYVGSEEPEEPKEPEEPEEPKDDDTTNTNSIVIPDEIKKLVFDANYYSNNHADLKKAFGTDEAKLYQHFIEFGIKEGRQAHPTFNIQNYLSENADIKATFGTDYVKGMKHFIESGHNGNSLTALNVDLGTEFYAKIGAVTASGKNLSLNDTNVILYGNSKAAAQTWRFVRQSDGSYIIINQKNGLALTVEGDSSKSGANVMIQKNTGTVGQKWFINANNGKYSLSPACASSCVLDVYGGETADLTNIQIYSKNNTNAQLFTITEDSFFNLVGQVDVGTGFTAKINNVKSGLNFSLNDTNVIIYTPSDAAAQKYLFERQSDGSYKLTNTKNNYVLTVEGGSSKNNTCAVISKSNDSTAQRWFIYLKEGSYIFRPACATDSVLEACGGSTEPETQVTIYTMNNTSGQKFTIEKINTSSSTGSTSGNKYATAEQMAVLRKIMYAVETGGQVYGNARYDDFTEAYTNTPEEHAITIGAGQWYGPEAKTLLNKIRKDYPSTFASLDTAGIAYDLDNRNWSTYKLSKSSTKAKCIVKIISSTAGKACQDELIDEQMLKYLEEARSLGVIDLKAMMMVANLRHLGGLGAVKRVLNKTNKPYTLDNIYKALQTDTGNQVGTFRSRNSKVYNWLKQYIG